MDGPTQTRTRSDSLSLILALLPWLPHSLSLHLPKPSCRLWISLSSRIQKNPSDSCISSLLHTDAYIGSAPHRRRVSSSSSSALFSRISVDQKGERQMAA
ncbi:hypothetical protein FQA47_015964 [Oryzias melastigma]|uniref:Uncharacterized protein n=1 Tax=Oryzias melastigma TaxID=30732 RepID=A0A834C5I6_ORYME|nr:hypothetical protein FQA47_015964 [Oryzias melastigma]